MQATATETFIGNLRGPVIRPMDADYDAVRSLYNGMIDKSPVMIARCTDVADVVTAVNFARQNDLQVAIRGGGHNGPGLGSVDNGLMIDMSMMKGVRSIPLPYRPPSWLHACRYATHVYGLRTRRHRFRRVCRQR
jgi:FAD/FMN-containing dehydrogenase